MKKIFVALLLISILLLVLYISFLEKADEFEYSDNFEKRIIYTYFPGSEDVCINTEGNLTECKILSQISDDVEYLLSFDSKDDSIAAIQIKQTWHAISEKEWRLVSVGYRHQCRSGRGNVFWNTDICQ